MTEGAMNALSLPLRVGRSCSIKSVATARLESPTKLYAIPRRRIDKRSNDGTQATNDRKEEQSSGVCGVDDDTGLNDRLLRPIMSAIGSDEDLLTVPSKQMMAVTHLDRDGNVSPPERLGPQTN
jgi:hypothetical protein